MGFLEKLTLEPGQVNSETLEPVRRAGVSDQAVREAILVCFCFSIMNRLADAFGFDLPDSKFRRVLPRLMNMGAYRELG